MGRKMYQRSTRRCAATSLDHELRVAIAAHAEQHQLGDVVGAAVECCETRSVRLAKPGLFSRLTGSGDKDTEHRTVAFYTPTYLVVATTGEVRGIHVRSARLEDVTLGQIGGALAAKAAELGADEGVSVTALWSGATGEHATSSFFVALDHAQGDTFSTLLTEAVTSAKRH